MCRSRLRRVSQATLRVTYTNRTLKVTRERALNEKINKSLSERVGQHIDERKRAKQAHLLTS